MELFTPLETVSLFIMNTNFLVILLKSLTPRKILGLIVLSNDLKWNKQVEIASSKANRMLGFIRRAAVDINDTQVRKVLYVTLVRSMFAYASQVWSPQTVNSIVKIERVQRRATKCILSLPYKTNVWNTLSKDLRDTTRSVPSFKIHMYKFYLELLENIS